VDQDSPANQAATATQEDLELQASLVDQDSPVSPVNQVAQD